MIDLHAHVVLEESLGAAGPLGPELVEGDPDAGRPPCFRVGDYELLGVRYRGSAFMDLDVRLDRMDELGIDRQVLSPNPLTFLVGVGPDLAVAFARTHNDAMSALVARSPERLGGLAQLPVQDVAGSVAELRRAVTDLGLLGAYVSTDPGRPLDDPRVVVVVGDVAARIEAARDHYDAILLDVDNGPDPLAHDHNARLYGVRGLRAAHRALRAGGVHAVWSYSDAGGFARSLERAGFRASVHRVDNRGRDRGRTHVIWRGVRR